MYFIVNNNDNIVLLYVYDVICFMYLCCIIYLAIFVRVVVILLCSMFAAEMFLIFGLTVASLGLLFSQVHCLVIEILCYIVSCVYLCYDNLELNRVQGYHIPACVRFFTVVTFNINSMT